MMSGREENDRLSEEEIARRRNAAVRRALQTPPKPKTGKGEGKEGRTGRPQGKTSQRTSGKPST